MISVSPAGQSHAEVLAGLHRSAFGDGGRSWQAADFQELLAMPGAQAWIASAASNPVGFLLVRLAGGEGEIISLGVAPDCRRGGVGRRLLVEALELAKAAGAPLFLEVASDNEAALGLYGAAGFTEVGRRANYYERGGGRVDALVLRRETAG